MAEPFSSRRSLYESDCPNISENACHASPDVKKKLKSIMTYGYSSDEEESQKTIRFTGNVTKRINFGTS